MNRLWWGASVAMLLAAAGCGRNDAVAPTVAGAAGNGDATAEAAAPAPAQAAAQPAGLHDIIETNDRYVVGISFPPAAGNYPGLAQALSDYAGQARAELLKALDELGNDVPRAPYELSLAFDMLVETPQLVAVAAEGSSYTGGAHGQPLVERFVWLPQKQQMLSAQALLDSPAGWQAISDYSRDKLLEQALSRGQEEGLAEDEQQELVRNLSRMIDEGTAPKAANFARFQPLLDADGRIAALRFVFPPYQVGPYSDGTRYVDVPAAVLLPHVAAGYRELFAH